MSRLSDTILAGGELVQDAQKQLVGARERKNERKRVALEAATDSLTQASKDWKEHRSWAEAKKAEQEQKQVDEADLAGLAAGGPTYSLTALGGLRPSTPAAARYLAERASVRRTETQKALERKEDLTHKERLDVYVKEDQKFQREKHEWEMKRVAASEGLTVPEGEDPEVTISRMAPYMTIPEKLTAIRQARESKARVALETQKEEARKAEQAAKFAHELAKVEAEWTRRDAAAAKLATAKEAQFKRTGDQKDRELGFKERDLLLKQDIPAYRMWISQERNNISRDSNMRLYAGQLLEQLGVSVNKDEQQMLLLQAVGVPETDPKYIELSTRLEKRRAEYEEAFSEFQEMQFSQPTQPPGKLPGAGAKPASGMSEEEIMKELLGK